MSCSKSCKRRWICIDEKAGTCTKNCRSCKRKHCSPITVKFRKGWDSTQVNALEFVQLMQEAGADAVTVHGRTREEFYSGLADWNIIAEIRKY